MDHKITREYLGESINEAKDVKTYLEWLKTYDGDIKGQELHSLFALVTKMDSKPRTDKETHKIIYDWTKSKISLKLFSEMVRLYL